MNKKKGTLFLIVGPSGVGKTTLVDHLFEDPAVRDRLHRIISYTTRSPRPGEQHGVDYFFVSDHDFDKKLQEGFFLEHSSHYKNFYGTSRKEIEKALAQGISVVMIPDRYGAQQVVRVIPDAEVLYILPPRKEILRERLKKRGETDQMIEFRVQKAAEELRAESDDPLATKIIVNDDLEKALDELKNHVASKSA